MYDEISIVILLGLILIFILLHFDFKNKINKFEKNFKNVKNTFNKKIFKMRKVLDNNFGKIVGKIDCEGEWKCNNDCIKEFDVYTYPRYGGKECPTEPGSDSIECIEEENCPKQGHQNCVITWGMCNSNCFRSWNVLKQSYGNGIKCPNNINEAIELGEYINNPYVPCENNIGNCKIKNCEGHWSECDTNCKKKFIVTEDENILGNCPNKNKTENCSNGEGSCVLDDVDCHIRLSPCKDDSNRKATFYDEDNYIFKNYEIIEESKGNGMSCKDTIDKIDYPQANCKLNANVIRIQGNNFLKNDIQS